MTALDALITSPLDQSGGGGLTQGLSRKQNYRIYQYELFLRKNAISKQSRKCILPSLRTYTAKNLIYKPENIPTAVAAAAAFSAYIH